MFEVFLENTLTSANQSGFKTGDLCIDQLLSIIHEIYISFDDGYEIRTAFLYISKAFDKLWYLGLFYKLRQNRQPLKCLDSKQRVVLKNQHSS